MPHTIRATITVTFIILSACNPQSEKTSSPVRLLAVGLAYDVSASVHQRELPVLTIEHVQKIITIVKRRGGAVALGLIAEKSFQPLTRLELKRVAGRLDERARANQRNKIAEEQFVEAVKSKIDRQRDAQITDIKGALARFSLFYGEPTIADNADKILIMISDGIDDGPWRKRKGIFLPKDVKLFVVGMERELAEKVFGTQATLFESIDAVVRNLDSTESLRQ